MTTVVATPGQGPDRPQEVSYTDTKVIGNGSFGVVYQAKLCETSELVAIKKVLQDKRFKVSRRQICFHIVVQLICMRYKKIISDRNLNKLKPTKRNRRLQDPDP